MPEIQPEEMTDRISRLEPLQEILKMCHFPKIEKNYDGVGTKKFNKKRTSHELNQKVFTKS